MYPQRVQALRQTLLKQGIDAFVLPRSDEYLNEDLAPADERLHWLSGFSGSQGLLVVTHAEAALLVDGRYSVQAAHECGTWLDVLPLDDEQLFTWLQARLPNGAVLAADARLHSVAQLQCWQRLAQARGWQVQATGGNPVDRIWQDRPLAATSPVVAHPLKWSGETCESKLQRIAAVLRENDCDALWLPAPDMLAWLLNVRGADIAIAPLPFSSGVLYAEGSLDWFIDAARLQLPDGWLPDRVRVKPVSAIEEMGERLQQQACRRLWVSLDSCNAGRFMALQASGVELYLAAHPLPLMRACKNSAELDGSHAAHHLDGVALCGFLQAYDTRPEAFMAADELDVATILEEFRCQSDDYRGVSFDTISACGANAAQPHYLPKEGRAACLEQGELLLIDSGGQYPQGTTDVTRVLPVGPVTERQRTLYTRVLRAHIALASCCFPPGTSGQQLDVLARQVMWRAGQDYAHGTGHGVGSYLSVHEGPQRIAPHASPVALQPGMITSIEPGLYLDGELGIRLENLYEVIQSPDYPGFLTFRALTLVPFERSLINRAHMSSSETDWLDDYHHRVCEHLSNNMEPALEAWLREKTCVAEQSAASR
ncbi:MAG: aminopeptidase P family protein [Pseudomonas sp.]